MQNNQRIRSVCRISKRPAPWALCAVVALLCFANPAARAGMITIDNFVTPNPGSVWVVPAGTNSSIEISPMSVGAIGGQRDALVSLVGTTTNPFAAIGILGYDT